VVRCSETNRKRSTDVVTISDCPDRKDLADDNDWRGLIIRWFVWRVADLNDRVPLGGDDRVNGMRGAVERICWWCALMMVMEINAENRVGVRYGTPKI